MHAQTQARMTHIRRISSSPLHLERANGGRGVPSHGQGRDRSHQISRLASGSPASAWLASRVCVCTYVIYLTPETTYVRALLASKIWRSATRYLACHSATCVDARARELKAFVHSTINA